MNYARNNYEELCLSYLIELLVSNEQSSKSRRGGRTGVILKVDKMKKNKK